jgi:hypothetical protein
MDGEHCLSFTNRDIRTKLQLTPHVRICGQDHKKQSSKVSRIFRRFHAHGLIARFRAHAAGEQRSTDGEPWEQPSTLRDHDFRMAYLTIAA